MTTSEPSADIASRKAALVESFGVYMTLIEALTEAATAADISVTPADLARIVGMHAAFSANPAVPFDMAALQAALANGFEVVAFARRAAGQGCVHAQASNEAAQAASAEVGGIDRRDIVAATTAAQIDAKQWPRHLSLTVPSATGFDSINVPVGSEVNTTAVNALSRIIEDLLSASMTVMRDTIGDKLGKAPAMADFALAMGVCAVSFAMQGEEENRGGNRPLMQFNQALRSVVRSADAVVVRSSSNMPEQPSDRPM